MKKNLLSLEEAQEKYVIFSDEQAIMIKAGNGGDTSDDPDKEEDEIIQE